MTARWMSTPMRCRPLCEPDTLPVSSLTHTPPPAEKARASLSSRLRANGVARKPRPPAAATEASSEATRSQ